MGPGGVTNSRRPGVNLRSGCQTCGGTEPCDCAKLTVRATKPGPPDAPAEKVRELSTTRKLRGTRLTPALRASGRPVRDFERYDLVVECVTGFLNRMDPPRREDCVSLHAEVEWSPPCANGRQHEVVLSPLASGLQGARVPVRGATSVRSSEPLHVDYHPLDQIGGNNPIGVAIGSFVALIDGTDPRDQFEIRASSCGVRPGGASPNGELTALVVLHRKMKVELAITLPPSRETLRVRGTASVPIGGGERADTTYGLRDTSQRYLPSAQRTTDVRTAGSPVARRDLVGLSSNQDVRQAPRDERDRDPSTSVVQGAKFEIKVNGREWDGADWLRRIFQVKARVEQALDAFMEMIHKAPQVGWRLEYTYQLLTGSLTAESERAESDQPIDGRLLPAPMQLSLQAELVLIKLEGTLSFGFRFEGQWGVVTARIEGKIGGEVKTTANLRIPGRNRQWKATGTIPIEVRASGELTVRESRVASAQLSVATGFELECNIFDDTPPPPSGPQGSGSPWKLGWSFKLKKGVLTARVESNVASFIRWTVTREIWRDQDLWPSSSPGLAR